MVEGSIHACGPMEDGEEGFQIHYDDGRTEVLFRYEMEPLLLHPRRGAERAGEEEEADDEEEGEAETASVATDTVCSSPEKEGPQSPLSPPPAHLGLGVGV